jgi:hypothetical protein
MVSLHAVGDDQVNFTWSFQPTAPRSTVTRLVQAGAALMQAKVFACDANEAASAPEIVGSGSPSRSGVLPYLSAFCPSLSSRVRFEAKLVHVALFSSPPTSSSSSSSTRHPRKPRVFYISWSIAQLALDFWNFIWLIQLSIFCSSRLDPSFA